MIYNVEVSCKDKVTALYTKSSYMKFKVLHSDVLLAHLLGKNCSSD